MKNRFIIPFVVISILAISVACGDAIGTHIEQTALPPPNSEHPVEFDYTKILSEEGFMQLQSVPMPNDVFISAVEEREGPFKNVFFIVTSDNQSIYQLPEYYGNELYSFAEDIVDISFADLNGDDLSDILIISEYTTGAGPQGMIPRTAAGFYIQNDDGTYTGDSYKNEQLNKFDGEFSTENLIAFADSQGIFGQ